MARMGSSYCTMATALYVRGCGGHCASGSGADLRMHACCWTPQFQQSMAHLIRSQHRIIEFCAARTDKLAFLLGVTNHWVALVANKVGMLRLPPKWARRCLRMRR